jgi:tetratricopeptide (TPR) repeat protein
MLALAMIVKNEAETIEQTLESVRSIIDTWYIIDTGSTDGTQERIQRALAGVPGVLADAPFVDFSHTRNAALRGAEAELAQLWARMGGDIEPRGWVLMLSGTEVLVDGASEISLVTMPAYALTPLTAYQVTLQLGNYQYQHVRLTRAGAGWAYKGRTHEVLQGDYSKLGTLDAKIVHYGRPGGEDKTERWKKDIDLLLADINEDINEHPKNARPYFYLARTYECLQNWTNAANWYKRRLALGGWAEELYVSHLALGRIAANHNHDVLTARQHFLQALDLCPQRVEAAYELGVSYLADHNRVAAFTFARYAWDHQAPPVDALFVELDMYLWKIADLVASTAYYAGEKHLGSFAAKAAFSHNPQDARVKRNFEFYTRLAESESAKGLG